MTITARIATLALLSVCVPGIAGAEVGEILKAHFKAVGGLDKLSDLKTIKREGGLGLSGNFGAFDGTIETAVLVGKKVYTHSDFGVGAETTAYNGTTGWKDSAQGLLDLSGNDLCVCEGGHIPRSAAGNLRAIRCHGVHRGWGQDDKRQGMRDSKCRWGAASSPW